MSSIEESLFDRYKSLEKKRDELARQVAVEEETFAKNSDPSENKTINYYNKERDNATSKRDREVRILEEKAESAKRAIDAKLKNDIEAIEARANCLIADYTSKSNDILSKIGTPTSLTYRRKKEAIDRYDVDILNAKAEWNRACDEQMQKRRANAMEENLRLQREADRKQKMEWEEARIKRDDEVRAQEAKDEAKRAEAGLETQSSVKYTKKVVSKVEKIEEDKPVKKVFKKLPYDRKKFVRMSLEEMEDTDPATIPSESLDDWVDRMEFLERKAERNEK